MKNDYKLTSFLATRFKVLKQLNGLVFLVTMLSLLPMRQANAQCYQSPNYCTNITATNTANYLMGLLNVRFGTTALPLQINNTSAAGSGAPIYFNYTNLIVRAQASDTVQYSVQVGNANSTTFRIYIDYNNDGTFATTAPELVYTSPQTTASGTVTGSFVLPSTLTAGAYRIRVASDGLNQIPQPCGPLFYSAEVEDYTLLVPSSTADLMSGTITNPTGAIVGNNNVSFTFTNISTTTITSVDVYYQLDNNTPVSQSLSSISVAPGATFTANFTTALNIPAVGTYNLRCWTDNPNSSGNNTPANDTICRQIVTYCSGPLSGTYTVNPNGSGTTNFRTYGAIDSALTSCGVSGPVVVNVTPGNYNEQLILTAIPGASLTNNIVFNGAGSVVEFNCNAANPVMLRLNGAKHLTFDSITFRSTSTTHGWGVMFSNNADSNTVKNCRIEIMNVTSSTAANSAGIVFSSALGNPLSSGNNGRFNTIENNVIKGSTSSFGLYYGIVGIPQSSNANWSANRFINNKIEDFFQFGVYWQNGNRTLFRGNTLTRTTKIQQTTVYGFYLSSQSRQDTFDRNEISNIFNASPTYTGTFFGWYMINYSGVNSTTERNLFTNNLLHKIGGNGPQYGFYLLTSFNNAFYNNTLLFDNSGANTSTQVTQGVYFTGGTSVSSIFDFRNNIINITRGGTGAKHALFSTGSWATGATINRNAYSSNSSNYNLASYLGVNYNTLTAWRAALTVADQQSIDNLPNFTNPAQNVYSPREGGYNGSGDTTLFAFVPLDFTLTPRAQPLDIGAFEANPLMLDAAMAEIVVPVSPYAAGSLPLNIRLRNGGLSTIDSIRVEWFVNGVSQGQVNFTGPLTSGQVSSNVSLGNFTFVANTLYTITANVLTVNGIVDPNPSNNSLTRQTAPASSGTITINATGTGVGVFNNFTNVATLLSIGGVSGPVTVNVTPASGPYTEQVFFNTIPGVNATNTITINGNGQTVQFNNTDPSSIGIINLIGADYMTFNNLTVRSLNASYGIGYIFTAGADWNRVINSTIDIGSVTGSSLSAGIAFTASLANATTAGNNGVNNIIENNLITGNATGGPFYAIAYQPQSTFSGPNTNNIFRNNNLRDFTSYGFYIGYSAGSIFRGNTMWRPTKASPTTFYGFYLINSVAQDTFENNVIKQPWQMAQTNTGTFYGYYAIATNTPANRPLIFRNNLMYDINFNGALYGFYQLSASNIRLWNNTFVVNHPTSTATSVCYLYYNSGTPTTTTLRNNIWFLNRGGSAGKYIYYLATTNATGYIINNNVVHLKQTGTNNHVAFHGSNQSTFAAWRLVNAGSYDANSVTADPQFRLSVGPEFYQPGTDSVNNIGFSTPDVVTDYLGAPRSTTPDPGAYEFTVFGADAGLTRISSPLNPITLGTQNVDAILRNFGASQLTSSTLNWRVNDSLQSPALWSGNLNSGDTAVATLGSYNFATPGFYRIKAWASLPNSVNDSFPINDTVNATVCTAISGNLYVHPTNPRNDTTFNSIAQVTQALQTCGLGGPVVVNIAPGLYNGAITFAGLIPGASPVNTLTFVGADSATTRIVHDGSGQRATIQFSGTKYVTFRNVSIENSAISGGGFGVLYTNSADSNNIIRCSIKIAQLTAGFTTFAGVASSANTVNLNNAGNNGNALVVDSCRIVGGYYGVNFYNNTAAKSVGNRVTNSVFINPYYYAAFMYAQNGVVISNNIVTGTGNGINTFACPIYVVLSDNGITITRNQTSNQLGGYGIYVTQNAGTPSNRNIIANNMLSLGAGTNQTYGIYDAGCLYNDIAHNAVNNTSGDASYVSCAVYLGYNNTLSAANLRMVNNNFSSPNGAMAVWVPQTASLGASSILINHNNYYSTSTYPFRIVNTIYQALFNYRTALGVFIPNVDTNSIAILPGYFTATNLRSINPGLDSVGTPITTVPLDIDGNVRSTVSPDIGVNEFAKPNEDAGVVSILQPTQPLLPGLTNVRVVVRNFGINTITSLNVHYRSDTIVRTKAITTTILPGATDTVLFDSISGPGATDQRFNFNGALTLFKAYTSMPNNVNDPQPLNDTASLSLCGALSGVYTINPTGTGANNFATMGDAINRLTCGGVAGNVTFNIASGTYTGQLDFGVIAGTSDSARITFQAATGNANDVIITSANSTGADNFTIRYRGTSFFTLQNVTVRNTNTSFGRVISINKFASTNTNVSNLRINRCVLEGVTTTSTGDALAIVYGPNGDNATNIRVSNSTLRQGSFGIWLGGQNIISLYSPGLEIDSNTFFQHYWTSINLNSRNAAKIRNNFFDGSPSQGYYAIFMSGSSGDMEISRNNMQLPMSVYAIYLATHNYYGEPGVAHIKNNVVNMLSTSTQYGLAMFNTSGVYTMNNTFRLNSPTTTYAYYYQGHTTSPTVPQVTASNNVRLFNNILWSNTGYAVYYTNFNAVTGTLLSDNNLYYTGGSNLAFVNGTNYTPANFYTGFRNAIYAGSDRRSLTSNITFTSNSNLSPLVTASNAWAASGRAQQTVFVNTDFNGNTRSTTVAAGAPDIGAYEFVPTSTPPAATFTGSIGYGNTQHMLVMGDTVATVVWGLVGTLPTSLSATYHTGALINNPTNTGANPGAHFMDVFWRINATGGSFYTYDLNLWFDPNMLGTVPTMTDLKLAKKPTGPGYWTHFGGTATNLDSVALKFGVSGLADFSDFTGTSDITPLPVTLTSFNAVRKGESDAALYWSTATEKNSAWFVIERAVSGGNFEVVDKVKAAGNSTRLQQYNFVDPNVANILGAEVVYYRLKMVDLDGTYEYSQTKPVYFGSENEIGLSVYPVPFNEQVSILIAGAEGDVLEVEMLDIMGNKVSGGKLSIEDGTGKLDIESLGNLPSGAYVVRVKVGDTWMVRKVMKY